jgi:hypothetical protein
MRLVAEFLARTQLGGGGGGAAAAAGYTTPSRRPQSQVAPCILHRRPIRASEARLADRLTKAYALATHVLSVYCACAVPWPAVKPKCAGK